MRSIHRLAACSDRGSGSGSLTRRLRRSLSRNTASEVRSALGRSSTCSGLTATQSIRSRYEQLSVQETDFPDRGTKCALALDDSSYRVALNFEYIRLSCDRAGTRGGACGASTRGDRRPRDCQMPDYSPGQSGPLAAKMAPCSDAPVSTQRSNKSDSWRIRSRCRGRGIWKPS